MATKAVKAVLLPIELELNENTANALSAKVGNKDKLVPELSKLLSQFLTLYSQGAFVVSPSEITRMSAASGKAIDRSDKVVEIVESAAGRKQGAYSFNVSIDPSLVDQFNDIALSRGMTLADVIEESWQTVMMMGWIYQIPDTCTQFVVSDTEKAYLSKTLGKNLITGRDIVDYIRKVSK